MRNTIRATRKRMNRIESKAAGRFDATLLHNRVYEAIGEDSQIRQLVDVAERAYQLEEHDQGYTDEVRRAAFGAAEDLNDQIEEVVEARIASECAAVITDARDGWFDDHAEDEEIEAAFHEACAWLAEHCDAADAADIDVDELVWDETDKAEEVTADA